MSPPISSPRGGTGALLTRAVKPPSRVAPQPQTQPLAKREMLAEQHPGFQRLVLASDWPRLRCLNAGGPACRELWHPAQEYHTEQPWGVGILRTHSGKTVVRTAA